MYKSKSLFFMMTISGTILTMSSSNWISMWMGLELNMMSFIPLISKSKSKGSAEASMIYFLTQSLGSMILMFSILMMMHENTMNNLFNNIVMMALMIKLGAAPFHMWMPEMMAKMSWNSCIMLMTWQKLAPLMMMTNMQINHKTLFMASILSTVIGAIGGLNQTSLRKLMGYSSINHLGWMISVNKIQNNWMMYWIFYSLMTMLVCTVFNKYNMLFINQINSINMTMSEKMSYMISMLSMGGLPPFLGFIPKWIAIQTLIQDKMFIMITIMVMMSIITLFFYMRTMTSLILQHPFTNKWMFYNQESSLPLMVILLNMSLPLITIINFM
uniref:NADH-ubiquinone oxidoreductase chain 2 n=1 Tax=Eusthenes cupreus TaxID=1392985 RepID=T1QDN9_9HEMI|nr:NADH dehydrogenase subunit 2 [Eusthenes cupreus]AFY16806.1 NADH dehydrogenase subunit 2 [Eusthenes cupreus]